MFFNKIYRYKTFDLKKILEGGTIFFDIFFSSSILQFIFIKNEKVL